MMATIAVYWLIASQILTGVLGSGYFWLTIVVLIVGYKIVMAVRGRRHLLDRDRK